MVLVGCIIIFCVVLCFDFVCVMNYFVIFVLFGFMVGLFVGGFIMIYLYWWMIFFINVLIGIYGIYFVSKYIVNMYEFDLGLFDWFGFLLLVSGVVLLLMGFMLIDGLFMLCLNVIFMCVVGVVMFVLYVLYVCCKECFVFDFSFLKILMYYVSVVGGLLFCIGFGVVLFLLLFVL